MRRLLWPLLFLLLILLPLLPLGAWRAFALDVAVFLYLTVALALAWDLVARSGQLSLAHGGFFGLGAYAAGLSAPGLGTLPALLLGGVVAALMALLLGGAPKEKSLLTGEEGWRTFKATGARLTLPRLVALLKERGLEVGKILEAEDGFYVDLRPQDLPKLSQVQGLRLEQAKRVEGVLAAPGPKKR